jgi:lysophospholipase L1-like esterase
MLALALLVCVIASAQTVPDDHWVGTWASAPVEADSKGNFHNVTLRQIAHTSVGGSRVRVQLSNEFGTQPLRIEDVHVAQRSSGCSIVVSTDRQLRFGGKLFAIVRTGAVITSDAIVYDVPSLTDLVISFYLPSINGPATLHPSAHQTNYIAAGDVSGKESLPEAIKVGSYYFLTNVDVQGGDLLGAVVTLGASITEGHVSTEDANHRWPDFLASRLVNAGLKIGVLNEGISGNRLLTYGAGPSALARFERDVLDQAGVRWVIFSDIPINDLGSTKPQPPVDQLIASIQQLIARSHGKHRQFFCSTLTPYQGANYWTPEGEAAREQINSFIRGGNSGCDAVIDQDLATRDPQRPTRYLPAYDAGDHLHPNDAGMQAIADTIKLDLFSTSVKACAVRQP